MKIPSQLDLLISTHPLVVLVPLKWAVGLTPTHPHPPPTHYQHFQPQALTMVIQSKRLIWDAFQMKEFLHRTKISPKYLIHRTSALFHNLEQTTKTPY